jgi:hypothetical protein
LTETCSTQSQQDIASTCDEIKELLLSKNRKYGDSALNPVRIFSQASTIEQIKVRNMSAISKGNEEDREEIVEAIIEGMIAEMTFEQMRNKIWDMLYEDLIWQEWTDLWMYAEDYAPELLERFTEEQKGG